MRRAWLSFVILGAGALACEADRAPAKSKPDGGASGDAGYDAGACPKTSGSGSISFDLECAGEGECGVSSHVTFALDPSSSAFPGCGVGGNILEIANLNGKSVGPLQGSDEATLEMAITPYDGLGKYILTPSGNNGAVSLDLAVTPACQGGDEKMFTFLIANIELGGDASVIEGGLAAPPSCALEVTSDCTHSDGTHDVAATWSCSFPSISSEACTIKNGVIQLVGCIP